MERESTDKPGTAMKVSTAAPDVTLESAAVWGASPVSSTTNRPQSPAPPPIWTRYIDSRLKQFCTR